jgi:hypothetical protein
MRKGKRKKKAKKAEVTEVSQRRKRMVTMRELIGKRGAQEPRDFPGPPMRIIKCFTRERHQARYDSWRF